MTRGTNHARAARPPVLGVDVGGVLVDRVAEGSDTSFFGNNPMATPAVPGCLKALRSLNPLFEGRIHIVSKAGEKISALTRSWLGLHGFLGDDVIPAGQVHFVHRRPEKHPICVRHAITHFVDDRLDVHQALVSVEHRYLFTGGLGDHAAPVEVPAGVMVCESWSRLVGLLHRDAATAAR